MSRFKEFSSYKAQQIEVPSVEITIKYFLTSARLSLKLQRVLNPYQD